MQRSLKFIKYLPEFGIQPFVLTVDEKFASYPLLDMSLEGEVPDNLQVVKTKSFEPLKILASLAGKESVPHGGFANKKSGSFFQKSLRFVRGNFFIPDARLGWVQYAANAATKLIQDHKIESVVISSPPHSSQLVGLKLKRKFPNLKWIADLRDPWTDIYYYSDLMHTKYAKKKDEAFELEVLKQADNVIAVSKSIVQMFQKKSGVLNPDKFLVLPNGFDESDFVAEKIPKGDEFIFTYVGTIAASYHPEIVFKAIRIVKEKLRNIPFKLRLIGTHAEVVKEAIDQNNLAGIVEYVSYVDHHRAVRYMQESNTLLLVIPDVANSEGILTGKLFEYLATRKPIIGIGPINGDAAKIIEECVAGKMFDRTQVENVANYISELVEKWEQGNERINESNIFMKYSRKELTKIIASYL